MSSKSLSRLFWLFAFLCIVFIFQSRDKTSTVRPSLVVQDGLSIDKLNQKYSQFYNAYKKVQQETDLSKKLIAIEQALNIAAEDNFSDKNVLQYLYLTAADIHQERWHLIFALEKYKAAQSVIYDRKVDAEIEKIRRYLSKVEAERGLNDDYIATKFSGPAKEFSGKVLVAYIFVDDGIKTRWSNKSKLRAQQVMLSVQDWQQRQASRYQVNDLEFINKTYVARRNPNLKSPKRVSFKSNNADIDSYVGSVMQTFGKKDIGEFVEQQMKQSGAQQGVVFLHTNLDQRSFARRCGYTHQKKTFVDGKYVTEFISRCRDEYVMLMEQVKRNRWDKMHYAQAHEMMHVFGAADLYNIKKAGRYAVTDIMNFQSKNLTDSRVEPITAYAIGWRKNAPQAPFRIIER